MLAELQRRVITCGTEKLNLPTSSVGILIREGKSHSQQLKRASMPFDYYMENIRNLRAVKSNGRYLIIQRAENNSLALVAGHVEQGESPEQAAIREAKEEVGLDLSKTRLSHLGSYPKTKGLSLVNRKIYAAEVSATALHKLSSKWEVSMAAFYPGPSSGIFVGGTIDCFILVGEPKVPNSEVKRLLLVPYFFLTNIRYCQYDGEICVGLPNPSGFPSYPPATFHKEEIMTDLSMLPQI